MALDVRRLPVMSFGELLNAITRARNGSRALQALISTSVNRTYITSRTYAHTHFISLSYTVAYIHILHNYGLILPFPHT